MPSFTLPISTLFSNPVGTLLLVFVGFGYAKPVPVNPAYFKKPRRDDLLVSIAGICMNLILFALFGTVFFWYINFAPDALFNEYVYYFLYYCAQINACLAVFNVLPLPPLDGYHVFNDIVFKGRFQLSRRAFQIGMLVVLALSAQGILGRIISAVVYPAQRLVLLPVRAIWG